MNIAIMKMSWFLILWLLCAPVCEAAKIPKPVLESVVTVLTGAAASASAATSAVFFEQRADIARELQAHGLDTADGAIYSLSFSVDPAASGRWFLPPNVYALVQIAGREDFIPASISRGYHGQAWMVSVYSRRIRPGTRVLVHILDDKEFWNGVLNSVLQSEIPLRLNAGITLTPAVKIGIESNGKFKILDRNIVFQPSGYLASADFVVPKTRDGKWLAQAGLSKDGTSVGTLQFAQVWQAPSRYRKLWMAVFWGGLAVVLGVFFCRRLIFPEKQSSAG